MVNNKDISVTYGTLYLRNIVQKGWLFCAIVATLRITRAKVHPTRRGKKYLARHSALCVHVHGLCTGLGWNYLLVIHVEWRTNGFDVKNERAFLLFSRRMTVIFFNGVTWRFVVVRFLTPWSTRWTLPTKFFFICVSDSSNFYSSFIQMLVAFMSEKNVKKFDPK